VQKSLSSNVETKEEKEYSIVSILVVKIIKKYFSKNSIKQKCVLKLKIFDGYFCIFVL